MDNSIAQHFKPDEQPFLEKVSGWIQDAIDQNRMIVTPFLNPREQLILATLVNRNDDLKYSFNGGFKNAEEQRALIFPDYFIPQSQDYEVQVLEIDYPTKFAELEHRQILGTLANLGIERDTFGDIVGNDGHWQFAAIADLAEFFLNEVTRIGRIKVKLILVDDADSIIQPRSDWEEQISTFASLRLDSIIAGAFNLSRQHVKELINAHRVQVNWLATDRADSEIDVNDQISVRKYGRVRLEELLGNTKKDKIRARIGVINSKK